MEADPDELTDRLAARDLSLWPGRRGDFSFLDAPRVIDRSRRELQRWADNVDEELVVIVGVGTEVQPAKAFAGVAAARKEWHGRTLFVCDTTAPETLAALPIEEAFVLVVSRNGHEPEARALFDYVLSRRRDEHKIALLAEEGSQLASRGEELRLERVFPVAKLAPGLGALSHYGAVPAVLAGYDLEELCGRAMEIDRHLAVAHGVALGQGALDGEFFLALTGAAADAAAHELMISTYDATTPGGSRGIVAVLGGLASAAVPGVTPESLELASAHELAAAISSTQITAAIAATILGNDPFAGAIDADVEARLGQLLEELPLALSSAREPDALEPFLTEQLAEARWLFIEAYLEEAEGEALASLTARLSARYPGVVLRSALAPGSCFTTGRQLHAGPDVVVVQIVARNEEAPLPVTLPGVDFATLRRGRAMAQEQVLREAGRTVLQVAVESLDELD